MSQPYPNQAPDQNPSGTSYQQPATAEDPGKTMGIIGLVLAFIASVIGIIVSAIALNKSKKAGFKNTPAKAGLIIGIVITVLYLIFGGIGIAGIMAAAGKCAELGPGVHQSGGVTITCS